MINVRLSKALIVLLIGNFGCRIERVLNLQVE